MRIRDIRPRVGITARTRVTGPAVLAALVGLGLLAAGANQVEAAENQDTLGAWSPTEAVEGKVRDLLAGVWEVDPNVLHLEWGRPRAGVLPPGFSEVDLLGGGRDGMWVVSLHRPGHPSDSRSVLLRAGVVLTQPVAKRGLPRGRVVSDADIEIRPRVHWGSPEEALVTVEGGWVTHRRFDRGELLASPGIRPPLMVESGSPVQVRWARGGVEISLRGRAVGSAAMGERVRVRTENGRRLDGIATGPGTVTVSSSTMERQQ